MSFHAHAHIQAQYMVKVKVHGYDNPTNRCPTCRHSVALQQGCCDNFDNTGSCEGEDKCDNSFFYCLKRLNSRPDSNPRETSRCGFHSSEGMISEQNVNGAPVDFSRSTALGIPNPFQLAGITLRWMVNILQHQLSIPKFQREKSPLSNLFLCLHSLRN